MTIRLLRSRLARQDVIDQAVYIGEHNPDAAARLLDAVEAAFRRLADYPSSGSAKPFAHPALSDLRMWPVPGFPNHLIFYRHRDDEVLIVRLLHGSRDIEAALAGDGGTH